MRHSDFYEMGDIATVLEELQDLGVDLDELDLNLTIDELVTMLNKMLQDV
jgi:hypothetical protein